MRRWAITSAVLVAMLAMATPVAAAPQWLSPFLPFDDAEVTGSAGTMTPDGTVAVARAFSTGRLEVRVRPPGGSFGPAVALIPGGGEAPSLVAGPNGHIAAVWRVGWQEYAAVRPPGGTFGEAHPIGFGSEEGPQQVAVDGSGRVWVASNGYQPARVLTLEADGSTNAFELGVGTGWEVSGASLGVDAAGHVTVVYRQSRSQWGRDAGDPCPSQSQVRVAEGGAAGIADVGLLAEAAESGIYDLGQCTHATGADIAWASSAVHPGGAAVATYLLGTVDDGGPVQWQTLARMRPASGAWPEAGTPAEPIGTSRARLTAVFAGETPIVLLNDAWDQEVSLSARGPGGWSAPQAVAPDAGGSPLLAASRSGTATVVYAGSSHVNGVVRAIDGTLSAPVPLSGPLNDSPRTTGVAMDDAGDAVAVWNEGPWYTPHVVAAAHDGAGPQLGALPGGGEVGEPVTFSAGAVDVWSGVASVGWTFGDGASATGDSATHVFDAVGTFPVSVTAVDGLGNVSARSTTLSIGQLPDTTRPAFTSRLWVTPKRVRRGHLAIIWFRLSEAATVQARVLSRRRGIRSGRRCVAPRRHPHRSDRRCRRTVRVASRSARFDSDGLGNLLLGTDRLRPGRYALAVDATDSADNRSRTVTLHLTVLPRARR